MTLITLLIFIVFVVFQIVYITIPVFFSKDNKNYKALSMEQSFTILVPAYNEEHIIEHCIKSINDLNYENYEVIIINDGSSDQMMNKLHKFLNLLPINKECSNIFSHKPIFQIYKSSVFPRIFVVDKDNGGKADSLNAGISYAKNDIIITLDADCILHPNALLAMSPVFDNQNIVAAGGMVHIAQGINDITEKSTLTFKISNLIRYQVVQYLTAFYLHKTTQATLNSITVISGAFGAFRKSILFKAEGYRHTIGEDMDITLRIQHLIKTYYKNSKIAFVPNSVCYTECPHNFKNLWKQRIRWQKGFIDCIFCYWKLLFKDFGIMVSIYLLFDSFLLGTINAYPTMIVLLTIIIFPTNSALSLILLSISFSLGIFQSLTALLISSKFGYKYSGVDFFKMLLFVPLEIISYRLLGLLFATVGTVQYFTDKHNWDKVDRVGRPKIV